MPCWMRTGPWFSTRRPTSCVTTLEDLRAAFGPDRRVALCRELTKLHEETRRTTLEEALAFYRDNAPKGEFVLVVAGRPPREMPSVTVEDGAEQVLALVARGVRLKDAARQAGGGHGPVQKRAVRRRPGPAADRRARMQIKAPLRETRRGVFLSERRGAHSSFSSFRHLGQTFLPLNTVMSLVASQKMQLGLYFFRMTDEPST